MSTMFTRRCLLITLLMCAAATAGNIGAISLHTKSAGSFGREGYHLVATGDSVAITAADSIGLLRGIQSLRQLLPVQIESTTPVAGVNWTVPQVSIVDSARFGWRGAMLDPARQFLSKADVLKYIDAMALLKLSRLHLHLTDSEGWRVQIDKYPRLTSVGAWYLVGGQPVGGFYTKDDIREIVAAAALRGIEVEPEIELPGHCMAALVSYPWLACPGHAPTAVPGHGSENDIPYPDKMRYGYCAGSDSTIMFLQDVLSEVLPLFPSRHVHLGTDELTLDTWASCPRCQARVSAKGLGNTQGLFDWFCDTIVRYVEGRGKRVVSWGGGTSKTVVKQCWGHSIDDAGGTASWGADAIQSPQEWTYFNAMQWHDNPIYVIPAQKCYSMDPAPTSFGAGAAHIMGAEACLWEIGIQDGGTSWYMTNGTPRVTPQTSGDCVEWMSFPRMGALAELSWTPQALRTWSEFAGRLGRLYSRFDAMDVKYYGGDTSIHADLVRRTALVPRPVSETLGPDSLRLASTTIIHTDQSGTAAANYLATILRRSTGYTLNVVLDGTKTVQVHGRAPSSFGHESVRLVAPLGRTSKLLALGLWQTRIVTISGRTLSILNATGAVGRSLPGGLVFVQTETQSHRATAEHVGP
jgi:hexosaminidase